jgi:epoxide hydrolase 4
MPPAGVANELGADITGAVADVNGVRIHYVAAGRKDRPLILLLHGFPETHHTWRKQIAALAERGFYVVAPDQRGYPPSDRPAGVRNYSLPKLAGDVCGLIERLGHVQAHVVGHDWGAAVAWWLALCHPERVHRLGIINGPHPRAMLRFLWSNPRQMRKSWYFFLFQLPCLSERFIRRNGFRALTRALRGHSLPGTFTDRDLDHYVHTWSRPGAVPAMLSWHRAIVWSLWQRPPSWRTTVPCLVIWGERDAFLEPGLAEASVAFCTQGRFEVIQDASHWVHIEQPLRVNALLTDFLGETAQPIPKQPTTAYSEGMTSEPCS